MNTDLEARDPILSKPGLTHAAQHCTSSLAALRWRPAPDRHRVAIVLYQTQLGRPTTPAPVQARAPTGPQDEGRQAAPLSGDSRGEEAGQGTAAAAGGEEGNGRACDRMDCGGGDGGGGASGFGGGSDGGSSSGGGGRGGSGGCGDVAKGRG